MTDQDRYLAMLTLARIEWTKGTDQDGNTVVTVYGGYQGFFCEHRFAPTGELKEVGAYE